MTNNVIFTTMAGLQAISTQMNATASNLANLQTPGYQALQAATEAAPYLGVEAPSGADAISLVPTPNLTAGSATPTGNPLNIALGGNAWLAVQTPNGTALTRNGSLQISSAGILSDSAGNPILGISGQPISLPNLTKLEIGHDGTVSGVPSGQAGSLAQSYGQLNLVSTPSGGLTPLGGSLFAPAAGVSLQASQDGSVQQGYLNASTAEPTQSMMAMIEGSRSYQLQTELLKAQSGGGQQLNTLLAQG